MATKKKETESKVQENESKTFSLGTGASINSEPSPLLACRFRIYIQGIGEIGIVKASLPETTTSTLTYREGHSPDKPSVFSSGTDWTSFVIEKAMSSQDIVFALLDWRTQIENFGSEAKDVRKNVSAIIENSAGQEVFLFSMQGAWISSLSFSDLDATSSSYFGLKMVLEFEKFEVD